MKEQQRSGIPLPTIKRIPVYVSVLEKWLKEGKETVSTTDFAAALTLKPVQVRKDLAFAGAEGKPRIGYRTEELLETLHRFVGWNNLSEAVLVGAGALGTAILGYKGFDRFGLKIKAAFDIDESKCGATVHGKPVYPIRDLKRYVRQNGIIMGIFPTRFSCSRKTWRPGLPFWPSALKNGSNHLTSSFSDVARPAAPCKSEGIITFVDGDSAILTNASNPFSAMTL